jgi:uncharacterized protein YcbK (DUF882 family)
MTTTNTPAAVAPAKAGDLSPHFSRREFACPCCSHALVTPRLVDALELLRTKAGGRAIHITSGYRCARYNRRVGGRPRSQHIEGAAADIRINGLSVEEMYRLARQIPAFRDGGIGVYPQESFIHVDVRRAPARWARVNGEYTALSKVYAA